MELKLRRGDYVMDGAGGLQRVHGLEALGQRVVYKLTGRRGSFPFWETLGSRLWRLGQLPEARRQAAAEQYVAEALADETGLTVERVRLEDGENGGTEVGVELRVCGETLSVTLEIP